MDINSSDYKSLVTVSSLAQECLLPRLERTLEDMSDVDKFMKDQILIIEKKLDQLLTILKTIVSTSDLFTLGNNSTRTLLVPIIVLVGEHQKGTMKPWSSQETQIKVNEVAKQFGSRIDNHSNSKTSSHPVLTDCFLMDFDTGVIPRKSLFFQCLQSLHSKLKKDDWKHYPAAVTSFEWIISQLKYPYLSDFIGDILPLSLLFADDYNDEHKMQGINCLDFSLKNFNKADLMRDNWTEVVYNAFIGLLNDKNPFVIDKLMPLLFSVLKIMEVDPHLNSNIFTKYDETMRKILFAIEFCTELQLKPVWVHHLTLCLGIMGHATLHWIDRICDVLLQFTATNDPYLWENILKCLQICIKNTWPNPNSSKTAAIILRVILNASVLEFPNVTEDNKLKIYSLAKDCIDLLKFNTDYTVVHDQIYEIVQNDKFHPNFRRILQDFQ